MPKSNDRGGILVITRSSKQRGRRGLCRGQTVDRKQQSRNSNLTCFFRTGVDSLHDCLDGHPALIYKSVYIALQSLAQLKRVEGKTPNRPLMPVACRGNDYKAHALLF